MRGGKRKTNICSNKRESELGKENQFNLGKMVLKKKKAGRQRKARVFWRQERDHYKNLGRGRRGVGRGGSKGSGGA